MTMEKPDPFGEPDDPLPDVLVPLSALFPEVTDEEAKRVDGETAIIMHRRARVMALYRRGKSMASIAAEIPCGLGTVHRDIHTVLDGYRRIALRSAAEHVADALQRLASREADIEAEWEKSKGEVIETETQHANGKSPYQRAKMKKKARYGDPRLAMLLIQCWDRRCKLLGLLRAEDFRKAELPPVKLVAGFDPAEAV